MPIIGVAIVIVGALMTGRDGPESIDAGATRVSAETLVRGIEKWWMYWLKSQVVPPARNGFVVPDGENPSREPCCACG